MMQTSELEEFFKDIKDSYAYYSREDKNFNENTPKHCYYRESNLLHAAVSPTCRNPKIKSSIFCGILKKSIADMDLEGIRAALYHSTIVDQAEAGLTCGADHARRFDKALLFMASLGFECVHTFFPAGLPESKNGYSICSLNTNLLLCLLYNNDENKVYDQEKILEISDRKMNMNSDRCLRGVTKCLVGMLRHDAALFNEGFEQVLKSYNRMDIADYEKIICKYAVSLMILAKRYFTREEFNDIKCPESKTFIREYCDYMLSKDSFDPKLCFTYPNELSPLNDMFTMSQPKTKLHQPYMGKEAYSKKEQNEYYLDCEQMLLDFIEEYRKNHDPLN